MTAWQVPAHLARPFREKRTPYCVCIPVLNEGTRLHDQLARMKPLAGLADIVIADGGSRDGSVDPERLKPFDVRTLLVKTGPGRLGAQLRMGFGYALEEGYDGVITMDGNDKDDPAALPLFIEALEAGYDHLQGSRYVPGGQAINTPRLRHWGVRLLHAPLLRRAAGHPYTDTTNGFRAYSRRFLIDPRVDPLRDVFQGYELHYYLAIRAARLGFKVKEVPVTRRYPAGRVPTHIRGWKGHWDILRKLWQACRGRFDPL